MTRPQRDNPVRKTVTRRQTAREIRRNIVDRCPISGKYLQAIKQFSFRGHYFYRNPAATVHSRGGGRWGEFPRRETVGDVDFRGTRKGGTVVAAGSSS